MRRLLLLLAAITATLTVPATPAAASPPAAVTTAAAPGAAALTSATPARSAATGCVPLSKATYRHTFDGAAGTLTVTAAHPLCPGQTQQISLVSYTAGAPGTAYGQFIYDAAHATLGASHRSVTLKVAVPTCYAQVDAFFGTAVRTETTSPAAPYGTAALGSSSGTGSRSSGPLAWYSGGAIACATAPRVTLSNACDGTFTATLANGSTADTQAVFLTGTRWIRLSPGRTTTVKVAKGKTLTIRDSSFTTHVATWRPPTTACAPTAPSAQPAAPQPVTPAPKTPAVTTASPSPSASASTTASYADAPAAYSRIPDVATTPTALARTGRGIGSIIAIGFGLLLIGAGVAAITYLVRLNRTPI